jgi:hypothetical protein
MQVVVQQLNAVIGSMPENSPVPHAMTLKCFSFGSFSNIAVAILTSLTKSEIKTTSYPQIRTARQGRNPRLNWGHHAAWCPQFNRSLPDNLRGTPHENHDKNS